MTRRSLSTIPIALSMVLGIRGIASDREIDDTLDPASTAIAPPASPSERHLDVVNQILDAAPRFRVTDRGAIPNDGADDGAAIREAIADAHTAGGGVVVIPVGQWESGHLRLPSRVFLLLDKGAVLSMSDDPDAYPIAERRWEGLDLHGWSPLIAIDDAEHAGIVGQGTIDGRGSRWWDGFTKRHRSRSPETEDDLRFASLNEGRPRRSVTWFYPRPVLLGASRSSGLLVEGVTLRNSPFWTVHLFDCEDSVIRGVSVRAPADSPNTDAMDIECSRRILIQGCDLETGDDLVAIKSGLRTDGRRTDPPCEDIVVRACRFGAGRSGFAIGSETSSVIRRVLVEDCRFDGSLRGVRIKTQRGRGGLIEGVTVRNCVMNDIPRAALQISMHYTPVPPEPVSVRTPLIRDIRFENITINGARHAAQIDGLDEQPIEDLCLRSIASESEEGASIGGVTGLILHACRFDETPGAP